MTSIGSIMSMAQHALAAAQAEVQVTSENVTNANTVGYSRKTAVTQELVAGGQGEGVTVASIQNAANQYLQQASLTANGQSASATAVSKMLDQAEQYFGDPSTTGSFFSSLDNVYSAFSTASDNPSSTLDRQSVLSSVKSFLSQAQSVSGSLTQMQQQASQQIGSDVTSINSLLSQISSLNSTITQESLSGGDPTGSQDQQNQLLNQLSSLMSVKIQATSTGGVTVRTSDGIYLAGDQGPSTLSFAQSGSGGVLTAAAPNGTAQPITAGGGDVGGLMQLDNVDLPQLSAQLGEYVTQAVTQLNAASNASSAVPAPSSLSGRQIGMGLSTAISGFSGTTNVAVGNSSGVVQNQVQINFSAGTMTAGGTTTSFNSSNFLTQLNTALGSSGTASFVNGALSISASGAGNGVAIADDTTSPSTNAGEGFSQFFGLNDLVASSANTHFNTGLSASDPNTFSGNISLSLSDSTGTSLKQTTVAIPSGGTMASVLTALNNGVGAYGSFSLNGSGALVFTSNNSTPVSVSVASDSTTNSAGGPSLTAMFGIGDSTTGALTGGYSVRPDIAADPSKMQFATLNTTAAAGTSALLAGDGSGALAMAQSGSKSITIPGIAGIASATTTVSNYASQIAGLIGSKVASADTQAATSQATAAQATSQLSTATGVNLDTELVNLTTYQQAYSASARLIQAANSMYDSLLQMIP